MSADARPAEILGDLLEPMGLSAWVETAPGGPFEPIAPAPPWLVEVFPDAAAGAIEPGRLSPFLENFLIDARAFWDSGKPGMISSGPWVEATADGTETPLEALAANPGGAPVLLIQALGGAFYEKTRILQQARDRILTLEGLLRIERALSRMEAARSGLIRALPDAMFRIRADGRFQDLCHAERAGLAVPSASDSRPWVELRTVLPADLAESFHSRVKRVLADRSAALFEYEAREGEDVRSLEARLVAAGQSEVLVIVRDISERKSAEAEIGRKLLELRRTRDDLLTILDRLELATLILDETGAIAFASEAAGRLLGEPAARLTGARLLSLEGFSREGPKRLAAALAGDQQRGQAVPLEWLAPGGSVLWLEVEIHGDPRDRSRRLLFLHDVSAVHLLRQEIDRKSVYGEMVGRGDSMRQVFQLIEDLAPFDTTVLIEGETGTGKELVARAIHAASRRKSGPFLAVNCAGLTESLVASQLFGHRRGAFTGAIDDHQGVFEAAQGGTLFLDEIGDVPPAVQTSLLRVLQEREITRLGESRPRKVDVRVLTATHRRLPEEVEKGRFRADLLYRLRVARISLPPLRERREDLPLLINRFFQEALALTGKRIEGISQDALRELTGYGWPGNVRELKSALEFAAIRCRGSLLRPGDLPPEIRAQSPKSQSAIAGSHPTDPEEEKRRYREALEQSGGNRAAAARLLGVSRATFYRRMAEWERS